MSTLHIYRASAGSGKTFTLTRKYLEKALADPQHFSRIAALTFTNKATAEMKARIFGTLNQLASGTENQHSGYLQQHLNLSASELTVRADLLRRFILSEYKDFTVTTLDKFFQRILRSFAREINVDTGYEPELDYNKVMDEIVDSITSELKPGMPLTEWISEYLLDKLEEGKSRDFRTVIKKLGMKIFDEDFRAIAHELEEIDDTYQSLRTFRDQIFQEKKGIEEQLSHIAQQALHMMQSHHLHPEDFKGGSKSPFKKFTEWAKGTFDTPSASFLKLADSIDNWYAKTSTKKEEIQAAYASGLFDSVTQIIQLFARYEIPYRSMQAASKNLFVFGIFSELVKKLESYREENNVLLLADAVDLLRKLTGLDDASFVYEKTGNQYDYYLLDEFQDTSGFQWDCTAPLIHNTLSQGFENMLVGDPKQSIYRWRGGDRELINSKVGEQFPDHQIHQLITNYRSRKNIIGFNNSVFSILPKLIFAELEAELAEAEQKNTHLDLLRLTYSDVVQEWSGNETGGFAKVRFFEKDELSEEEEYKTNTALIETVKDLQDRGFRAKDISILVRKNTEAKWVADVLQNEKWLHPESAYVFDIISDEASYLENSGALSLLIHIAQFLLNPTDAVNNSSLLLAWNQIRQSGHPLNTLLWASKDPEQVRTYLPEEFVANEQALSRKAPGPLFDSLVRIFSLHLHSEEFSYLAAFRDLITNFSTGKDTDLQSFINHWNEKGRKTSVKAPDDAEAIRIMTFHKCKGLEFEAVIIPYFSEKTDHSNFHSVPLWVKSNEKPFNGLPYFPVDYNKGLKQTLFAERYFTERMEAVSDALNLAYVAFTRAKTELHIFAEKPSENSKSSTTSNLGYLLYHMAQNQLPVPVGDNFGSIYHEDENELLVCGEPGYFSAHDELENKTVKKIALDAFPTTETGEKLKLRNKENPQFYSSERRKGIILHKVLSELQDIEHTQTLIEHLVAAGELSQEDIQITNEGIMHMLADEEVSQLFSKKAIVKTESNLITASGQLRIPDRIAILGDTVYVGDFKTGKKEKSHPYQVREYMQLLADMGYKKVIGLLLYTATGETEKIKL